MEDKVKQAPVPHSLRANGDAGYYNGNNRVAVQGRGLSGNAVVYDDRVVVTFSVPGIPPEQLKVVRAGDTVRVSKLTAEQVEEFDSVYQSVSHAHYYLADGETVEDVDLDLGILTIIIDRNVEVEEFTL